MKFSFKLVTALIAVILTVCCITTVFVAADVSAFTDFPAGSWSDAALRAGVANGLIIGKGDGRIAPKDYITRAETATIINRAFGATVKADISQYTDVSPSKWYYAEMQKAVNMRTVEGVSSTQINPEGYITREQVFTILARALVLSDTDETKLMTFADGSSVSSWARGYTAALVNRGYVNGNTENRLKPQDYITREEFAQVMHNIFKQYIVGEDYKLSNATYGTTVVRTPNLTLNNLVINGDLIVADGVGRGDITLKNVRVSGRILFRGGEGKVKIEDGTTTGQFVIVHDVNGTVNFHNYRTHPLFKNIVLDTHATFLKPSGGSSGTVSPGGPTGGEKVKITFGDKDYYVSKGGKLGDAAVEDGGETLSEAIDKSKAQTPGGYTRYFINEADGKVIDLNSTVSADMKITWEDLKKLYVTYDANGGTMKGEAVYKDEANYFDKRTPYTFLADTPLKDNNTFIGWYDNIEGSGEPVTAIDHVNQADDVYLYADWEPYAVLDFINYRTSPEGDFVFIDVVIDKLPYGSNAITYIEAAYSVFKEGTTDEAELTYVEATSTHGGTISVNGGTITLEGVNITSGGVLFTIKFSKEKDYKDTITFAFGAVTIKENDKILGEYTKDGATYSPDGKEKYTIFFNNKYYVVFEGEEIGDAKCTEDENYTLAKAFNDYKDSLPDGTYNSIEFKTNTGKVVTKDYVVGAGENLTKITAEVDYIKYDVIYKGNGGTIDGKSEYTVTKANAYNTSYTLISKNDPRVKREGYIFNGWYIEGTSSTDIIEKIPVNTKGPVTVIADWIRVYEIEFNDKTFTVFEGEEIGDAKCTEDENYTLAKAFKDYKDSLPDGTYNSVIFVDKADTSTEIKEDYIVLDGMTIKEIIPVVDYIEYTITYVGNGGTVEGAKEYTDPVNKSHYGKAQPLLGETDLELIYPGYKFDGWYMEGAPATEIIKEIPERTVGPVRVYAKWSMVDYKVVYDANGGAFKDGRTTITHEEGHSIEKNHTIDTTQPFVPEREGFEFTGWYKEKEEINLLGDTIDYVLESGDTITIYAGWTEETSTGDDSVLKFDWSKDEDAKTVTVKVILTNIPKDIENLAAIEIHYTRDPGTMAFQDVQTRFRPGEAFDGNDGVITWLNSANPITPKMLADNNNVLFEIVYTYTLPTQGNVTFSYDKATFAQSGYPVVEGKDYKLGGAVTVPFDRSYTVKTNIQKVTDAPDADPKAYDTKSKDMAAEDGAKIEFTPDEMEGFDVEYSASNSEWKNDGTLVINVYYNRKPYTVEFNGEKYDFLYGQYLFKDRLDDTKANDLAEALKAYAEERLDEGFIVTYTYGSGGALDPDSDDIITGEVTIEISEVPVDDEKYTVTFYNGTTENKGSIEVEAGSCVSQADVDEKLGSPEDYKTQKGYTNSDGIVHEIYPELWYKDGDDWKIFVPDKVKIVKDTDVYLLTRYVAAYYDTDFEFRGIKLPQKEIVIPYDSNTDLWESAMDTLTATRDVIASTLYDVEYALDVDLFSAMLEKAAKTGIVDADGNILNPEVPVPLHKLLTEELIMEQIDNYIDSNINNEEFIAEILRNDTVVNMLLDDASIREKVLSDEDMRAKLLTTSVIKRIISNDDVIEWIITNEDFKKAFIDSDATFDYIVGDLKELLDNDEYRDMIIDACVEFVIDVYFEKTISAPELVHYIDTVLDSPEFIADIESKPELRSLFKNELKGLLTDLDDPATSQETRDEVYAEIRGNDTMQDAIIDAVLENDDIMDDIMTEVRTDLSSATSQYRDDVITAVRTEFADPLSTLKAQIIAAVKDDLKLGAASALRDTVIDAITTDFNSAASQLKDTVITTAKTEITTPGSSLRKSILAEAATQGSDIAKYIKDYASTSDDIKQEIKPLVKDNADVKNQAKTWISSNIASVKDDIKTALKTDTQALKIAITKSDSSVSDADAQRMAEEYTSRVMAPDAKAEIDSKIDTFFVNDADVLDMVEDNFDTFYLASYDTIFDELYADPDVFAKAYESYVSDSFKLEDAFNRYVSVPANLETAVNKFIENTDNLADAIELFIDSASTADIEKAADVYIADDDNLISAVNTYIEDDNNLSIVFDIFKEDEDNLKKAFETYIADDDNLGDAIHTFAANTDVFDKFYEDHLSENAADPETFNELFEAYYHSHVHDVADKAWDNAELHDLVMTYVHDYTGDMVEDYADGTLAIEHPELVATIDALMHDEFPEVIRQKYYEDGSTIKASVDHLIEEEGTKLIKQYANDEIADADTVTFIEDTIEENIDIIVDDYVDGTLDKEVRGLIDAEIDSYMEKLINDYINDVGDARETLGELVPTYAQDAVDTLKATDAFINTISDFTSGNGVRVNEGNIMFISILSDLMGEYDYDKIMADFAPEKVAKLADKIGHDLAAKYVNTLLDTFVDGIKDAEDKLQADLDNDIEGTEYKFTTTPRVRVYIMDDFVVDMYNKAMPKAVDKLNKIDLIAINPYAQKLINKNWITELLDYDSTKVSEEVSGYSIKKGEYDEEYDMTGSPIMTYIDIVLENTILLYDAVMWYGDYYGEATVEAKLDAVSALMGTYANKANDIIMHYIQTGELPKGYTPYEIADKILDRVLGVNDKIDDAYNKVEDKYYENEDRILELVDKMKNFYTEKLDKDYTEVIDLASLSVYADGKAYPVYKILLGISDKDNAFNIDTLAEAIDDSDNYHGINAIEKGMNKIKSKLAQFEEKNVASALRIIRNAYKFTLNSREIKGRETGTHTVKLHRYFE